MAEEIQTARLIQANISEVIKEGNVPTFYINGFTIGYSATEAHMILSEHGKIQCVIQLPFPITKSLIAALSTGVSNFEEKTGIKISSLEEIQATLIKK